ncbi:MAG: ABC transporter substrate-binding protein [Candidatus Acetothermia bacterium]
MITRKITVFAIAVLLIGVLAAGVVFGQDDLCVDTTKYAKEPPYTIGYDTYWLGNAWSVQFDAEFKRAAELYSGLIDEVIYTSSDGSTETQISNIEDLISRGVDAIIVTPNSPTGFEPVLRRAEEAGIPVIMNSSIVERGPYTSFLSVDDVDFGRKGAEWLVEKLDGEGKVLALSGKAGIAVSEDRWQGAKEVFDEHQGIEILAHEYANWSRPKAKQVVASLLPAHPQIDAVWSGGGSMTAGAIEAFLEADKALVPMTGEDQNGFLKLWYEHRDEMDSIALSKPTWLSAESLKVAVETLQGIPVPRKKFYSVPTITDENLEEFVRPELPDSFWARSRLSREKIEELFD